MTDESITGSAANNSAHYTTRLFAGLSGRLSLPGARAPQDHPLIVALHGGTYTSRYFDVPGYSLFERAALLGIPVIAPDRPGYGESIDLPPGQHTLRGSAAYLRTALGDAWRQHGGSARGIVLVAHSIGAAIAMMVAGEALEWPLLGIAISGVGLRTPPQSRQAWSALPNVPKVLMPAAIKDEVMFGPAGSFDSRMPDASHVADTLVPKEELLDIVTTWQDEVATVASRITVPVHYRQGEFDKLWIVGPNEVQGFAAACSASPFVDAAMLPGIGHCIDFHRTGAAFHIQQLGFALQCAALQAIGRDGDRFVSA